MIVEGTQATESDETKLARFCDVYNAKYEWDFTPGTIPGPVVVDANGRVGLASGALHRRQGRPVPTRGVALLVLTRYAITTAVPNSASASAPTATVPATG